MRMERNFRHTTKAALAFVFTTATYLLARTTGFLPSWLGGDTLAEDRTLSLNDGTGNTASINASQRQLLQHDGVAVVNPIPDQVIEVDQQYTYKLDNIFSGNYSLLGAVETGQNKLPGWLTLQPKLLSTYPGIFAQFGMAISGNITFTADLGSNGLQIFDVSDPVHPRLVSYFDTSVYGIAVSGSTVFVAASNGALQILDVSNTSAPQLLSTCLSCAGSARAVAISGSTAFVANYFDLRIVDVSNTSNPKLLSNFSLNVQETHPAYNLITNGVTVFMVGAGGQTLYIIDVSNTSNPRLLSTYPIYIAGFALSGNTLFVAGTAAPALQILDVTNTSNPRFVSSFFFGLDQGTQVAIRGDTLFFGHSTGGLKIIDVSNLTNLLLLSSFFSATSRVLRVAVSENKVIVTDQSAGLQILDVKQGNFIGVPPSSLLNQEILITLSARDTNQEILGMDSFKLILDQLPRLITSSVGDQSIFPGGSITLSLSSETLFVNPRNSFLRLSVALSNKLTTPSWLRLDLLPRQVFSYPGTSCWGVQVNASIAYVACDGGLKIINITNPSSPQLLFNVPISGIAVEVSGGTAFVADVSVGVHIINVTNMSNPFLLSSFSIPGGNSIGTTINGNIAFIADDNFGLEILNISNLTNPRLLSTSFSEIRPRDISIRGNTAFVASNSYGLQVFNVSNLTNPQLLSTVGGSLSSGLAISGTTAFVAGSGGLQIVNVSDIRNPRLQSIYPFIGGAGINTDVVVSGKTAFYTVGRAGLEIIDVSNTSNPRLLSTFSTGQNEARGVAISGSTPLVTTSDGLRILDISQWQFTITPGVADVGNYRVQLVATDDLGSTATTQPFTIRVEGPPQFRGNISIQFAKVGQTFNYFVPQGLVTDPNFDIIVFTATLVSAQSLPSWLSFNPIVATFAGIPREANVGNFTILLSATDNTAGSANTTFGLYVDHAPVLNQPIAGQVAGVGLPYQFIVPSTTIIDLDNDMLLYTARQQSGNSLPSWINFNNITRRFSGLTNQTNSYTLVLLASDPYGGQASAVFNLLVENFPRINQSVVAPAAGVGRLYSFVIPGNSFSDLDHEPLTYGVQQSSGSALPNWLAFNPADSSLSGVPSLADLGELPLRLTATDPHGGSASQNFTMVVTHFPMVATPIANQLADVGRLFQLVISNNTFVDLDNNETLSYSAQSSGGLPLPNWLRFNTTTRAITGTPNVTQIGNYPLIVLASDPHGATATANFNLLVEHFPQVNQTIVPPVAGVGIPFNYLLPTNSFIDLDNAVLSYRTVLSNGGTLPNWLSFNPNNLLFSGVPQATNYGVLQLQLIATDSHGASARQLFNLTITYFPTVAAPITNQLANVDRLFQLIVPNNTFVDLDSNETLSYSAQSAGGLSLPNWLNFNTMMRRFSGTPNATQTGNYSLIVVASDQHGANAMAGFNLFVENFLNQTIVPPPAGVGIPFNYLLPVNSLALNYRVTLSDGSSLPNWLSFNPSNLLFSGVPQSTDRGLLQLQLIASSPSGGSARELFNLTVTYFPAVSVPIPNQLADVGRLFQLIVPNNTFIDLDSSETLFYSAQSRGGLPLPGWLNFNATMRRFSGTPNVTQTGDYSLIVLASDQHGATATAGFNLFVENFLNQTIVPPPAGVGISYHYLLPVTSLALSYRVTFSDGSNLPNWLSFNPSSLLFSGVPQSTDRGLLLLQVIASDSNGASTRQMFNLTVTYFPTVVTPIVNQLADVDRLFQLTILNNTFVDLDNEIVLYSAQSAGGLPLPNWLSFNTVSHRFSGTPNATQIGNYSLIVLGSDPHGATAAASFNLFVEYFPQVNQPIAASFAGVGIPFNYLLPVNSFTDLDNPVLSYRAVLSSGGALPNWLSFNPSSQIFLGVPHVTDRGVLQLRLIASDPSGASAQQNFNLTVTDFPQVVNPIVPPSPWRENRWSTFQVPNNTFNYAVSYNASQSNSLPLPSWLQFNTTIQLFSGTPTSSGVSRSLSLVVIAADVYGNAASAPFNLVINPNYLPQVVAPISDQLANVNQRFVFFIPAGSFVSRNQEALSYSAGQSRDRLLPAWLHFDNESLSFSGMPGRGDTDPFTPRALPIEVSISDSGGKVKATFNINVQGTSWYGLALIIGGPLISGLSFLYAAYQYRALYYNCRNKKHYQKLNTEPTLIVGEPFYYALAEEKIEAVKINTIQAKIPKMQKQGCGFFNSISQENFQALPGGQLLPSWMEYDMEQNCLRSDGPVPSLNYKNLRIEVSDEAGIILKQINLSVQKSKSLNITLEEEAATFISAEAKHASENAVSEVELQPLNPPENLTPRFQESSTPSRSSVLSALSVTNSGNKEGQPTRTGKVELSNLSSF